MIDFETYEGVVTEVRWVGPGAITDEDGEPTGKFYLFVTKHHCIHTSVGTMKIEEDADRPDITEAEIEKGIQI